MPNKAYSFTKRAVKDLSTIWNYTYDLWSEKQADKYYKQIINRCNKIARNPESGRNYPGIVESLKGTKINKHIIFYRILDNQTIEIERILHERMDLKKQIND